MQIDLRTDADGFLELRKEWDELLDQSSISDAFLTWEWLSTWWKHHGHRYSLRLLTVRNHGALVGIAPLMLEKRSVLGVPLRVLRNIGDPPPDVGGFLVRNGERDVLAALGRYIAREIEDWDVLILREIPAGSLDLDAFVSSFPGASIISRSSSSRHLFVPIGETWESYFQRLSGNLRKDLRKKIHRISKTGELDFRRYMGAQATQDHMRIIFEINKRARHPHLYEPETEREFHLDLAQRMAERGWLDVSFLYLEGEPVAFRYGFLYDGCFEDWRTGFDARYFPLSVGKVLQMLLVKDCFERGVREFHFLRGEDEYKERWQALEREFVHPLIIRRRLMPLALYAWLPDAKSGFRRMLGRSRWLSGLMDRYDRWSGNK